jgi:hypothetical protein
MRHSKVLLLKAQTNGMECRRCIHMRVHCSFMQQIFVSLFFRPPRDKESTSLYIFNLLLVCIMRVKSEEASN